LKHVRAARIITKPQVDFKFIDRRKNMRPYEVTDSEITYRGKIVDVIVDTIVLPNGRTARREIVLRGEAAAVLPVDSGGNVYLARQYRHSLGQMTLEIPAGMVETNESPEECARRELTEETGLMAGRIIFMMKLHGAIGFSDEAIHIYAAEDLQKGDTDFDDEEFITVETYPLNEAIELIRTGAITDGKTSAALYAYAYAKPQK